MHSQQPAPAPAVSGSGPVINEYTIPTPYSHPFGIAVDSKDNIWFTAQAVNKIVKFDPAKTIFKEYLIPSAKDLPKTDWKYSPTEKTPPKDVYNVFSVGSPGAMTMDKNDRIWFVEHIGNKIGFFDPAAEQFTEYDIPTPQSNPYDIAIDSEGNVWFVEWNGGKIGKLDFKLKKVVEYDLKKEGGNSRPASIAVDAEDNIWIGDIAMNVIGRFNPKTNAFKVFPVVTPLSQPGKILIDSSKNIWFTEVHSHKIAMLIPSTGVISEADVPGYNSVPQSIIIDKKGRVWYIDNMRNKIGYFAPHAVSFSEFDIPTMNSQPMSMAIDSKGDIWFTENDRGANKIASLVMSTVPDTPATKHSHPEENLPTPDSGIPLWVYLAIIILTVIIVGIILAKKRGA
ncbi:MAG: hypothetical protein HY097_06645 [Nitrospinae bacterium]|nr:hypothetical protein [Nitrospinota bacterium]MBI3815439.1 hypothetical protein [Nitrospinota bacterium]